MFGKKTESNLKIIFYIQSQFTESPIVDTQIHVL
jgi:hypothetical protein